MAYSVGDLKTDIVAVLHGTTLNQIQSINALINRAARKLLNDVDPIETERTVQINTPLYDKVYNYALPNDLKDDRIIDIYPQVHRKLRDRFFQKYNEDFDLYKDFAINHGDWTIEWNNYQKFVRIAKKLRQPVQVNPATTIDASGLWAAGGTASNLQNDNLYYVYGNDSLRFDLGTSTNPSDGYLENTTFPAVDLSTESDQGALFAYVYIQNPTTINNFTLRWGSSAVDYFENTTTANFFGNSFELGWNLLKFDWQSSTTVGNPDFSSIGYLRFNVNYDGTAQPNVRLNSITAQLGSIYYLKYYSKFLFRDEITGAFKEEVTNDADLINLDTTSYNMLTNLCAYFAVQQQKSNNGQFDASFFLNEYNTELKRYVNKIRSQVQKPQAKYYKMPPKKGLIARRLYR